ncbi:nuclear transport factor 2 family protein [Ramlibacter sp. AW1]|uniref:Nuclear transport factor 2 family protein n=1 Tax=Ramlibacter aurantiacus TaxID=2801330 RepID=A0A937D7W6_9BURK|nr:aromatic-ring-hydroxylating dioxygenase subunit beta [Ramlibacter aurantiacus]MBL0422438.1 nuclear transport factor 2 family protein [Ramlibacter aurantiacus]
MDKDTALDSWMALREVELFLFKEAELADTHQYQEWFKLFTQDLLYWVPCNSDDSEVGKQIALINDNRPELDERLYRLSTKHAHAQSPKSRLSRIVSNVVLGHDYQRETGGTVTSRVLVTEVRNGRTQHWAGRVTHVLVREDGVLRMKEKRVYLAANDEVLPNLTFII